MTDDQQILKRATAAFQSGDFETAAGLFRDVINRNPEIPELYVNLGASLRGLGQWEQAENTYRQAIERAPENPLAWFNFANVLRDLERWQHAIDAYRTADALQPDVPEILNNLGSALYQAGRDEDAVACFERLTTLHPGFSEAFTNKGNALQRLLRFDEANTCFDKALALDPNNALYRLNKCAFLAATGDRENALHWADRAIEADPTYVEAKLKKASLLIQQGDLKGGFELYETRWDKPDWHSMPEKLAFPPWQGEDLTGKHLLVWNEQGYGDALMYARFFARLRTMAAGVTFACEPPLHRLLQQSLDGISVVDLEAPPPNADFHLSLMSLPHALEIGTSTDVETAPYLKADDDEVATWKNRLDETYPDKCRVGVVWAGNPRQAHDYARSMAFDFLHPLLERHDCAFFNLMVGPRGDVTHHNLIDMRPELTDFAATASLMTALDLVISVDSAPAHLGGAVGTPTWILLSYDPDSRYFLNSTDMPWYPSVRLFRQPAPGDWGAVVEKARTALDELVLEKT